MRAHSLKSQSRTCTCTHTHPSGRPHASRHCELPSIEVQNESREHVLKLYSFHINAGLDVLEGGLHTGLHRVTIIGMELCPKRLQEPAKREDQISAPGAQQTAVPHCEAVTRLSGCQRRAKRKKSFLYPEPVHSPHQLPRPGCSSRRGRHHEDTHRTFAGACGRCLWRTRRGCPAIATQPQSDRCRLHTLKQGVEMRQK